MMNKKKFSLNPGLLLTTFSFFCLGGCSPGDDFNLKTPIEFEKEDKLGEKEGKLFPILISFETLAQGVYSGYGKREYHKIDKEDEFKKFLDIIYSTISPRSDVSVDFNKESVLAVFLGEFSSGGYSVEIEKIEEREDSVIVVIKEMIPGVECATTDALTQPFHLVKTEKIQKKVEFLEKKEIYDCGIRSL